MKCKHVKEILSLYLNNLLSDTEKNEVEQHLKNCPVCQRELAIEKEIQNDLEMLFKEEYIKAKQNTHSGRLFKKTETKGIFFRLGLAIAATILLTISLAILRTGASRNNPYFIDTKITNVSIKETKIKDIKFIDEKLKTKVKKIGNNIFLVNIQGGRND